MIERVDGLGFSLKPPAWLREAVSNIVSGKPASVPTPRGPITIPAENQQAPNPIAQVAQNVNAGVGELPGGWLTIAAIGAAALFVLPKMFRGRR